MTSCDCFPKKTFLHVLIAFYATQYTNYLLTHKIWNAAVKYIKYETWRLLSLNYYFVVCRLLNQRLSTFGGWRPSKQNKTQIGDPYTVVLKYYYMYYYYWGFGDQNWVAATQKCVATHLLRNIALNNECRERYVIHSARQSTISHSSPLSNVSARWMYFSCKAQNQNDFTINCSCQTSVKFYGRRCVCFTLFSIRWWIKNCHLLTIEFFLISPEGRGPPRAAKVRMNERCK